MKKILKITTLTFSLILMSSSSLANQNKFISIESNNIIQGFSIISPNKFYTLEQQKNGRQLSPAIFRYVNNIPTMIFQDDDIGHQGFSLESNDNGQVNFWTSGKDSPVSALRYEVDNQNNLIKKTEVILFPPQYDFKNETVPTVSSDNRYLIVRGRTKSRVMFIRVFDLSLIKNELKSNNSRKIDVSNKYIYTWLLPSNTLVNSDNTLRPLQAMASDGSRVYILYGNAKINSKTLFTYSMNGKLIKKNTNIDAGRNLAETDPGGYFYEPEGISFIPHDSGMKSAPYILFVSGKGNSHINRIFEIAP